MGVSTSGYYEWKSRAPSARSIRNAWLTDLIGQVHEASHGTYGQPRVRAELQPQSLALISVKTSAIVPSVMAVAPSTS